MALIIKIQKMKGLVEIMPDLFRLSDDDFKNIGCTNAELEEVKKCNDALNKLGQSGSEEFRW